MYVCLKMFLKVVGVFICVIYSTIVSSHCVRYPNVPTIKVEMAMGRVVVPPDLPVNSIIASKSWSTGITGYVHYSCAIGLTHFVTTRILNRKPLGDYLYETNIPGIGIKMYRGTKPLPTNEKKDYPKKTEVNLNNSVFKVELIKTAEVTGSGVLEAGIYTSSSMEGDPLPGIETVVSFGGIVIVSPSCNLLSGRVTDIYLQEANVLDFKGKGSIAAKKDFDIKMQCSGGLSEKGYANINLSFSGKVPTGMTNKQGVLVNENETNSGAKGIGIQIIKDNQPLVFDDKYLVGKLINSEKHYYTVPLSAQYYQYENKATTGSVESHMVFNLTYD